MIRNDKVEEFLKLLGQLLRQNFRKRNSGVTIGEGALLALLSQNASMTAGELGEKAGLGSGRIANLLKAAEAKGYVIRHRDESDGRKIRVCITQTGREECERRREEFFSKGKALLERLGEEDTKNILRILKKLTDGN